MCIYLEHHIKQTCKEVYMKHFTRGRHQLKMSAPSEVNNTRSDFRIRQFLRKHHFNIATNQMLNMTVSFIILESHVLPE